MLAHDPPDHVSLSQLPNDFQANGFATVSGTVSDSELAALRGHLTRLHMAGVHDGADFTRPDGKSHLKDVLLRCSEVADALLRPQVIQALRSILGSDFVVLFHSESHYRSYFPTYHQDSVYVERELPNDVWKSDFNVLKVSLYLQKHSPEYGGGLELLPGTHRRRHTDERGVVMPWRVRSQLAKELYWKLQYRALYHDRALYRWAHSRLETMVTRTAPEGFIYPLKMGDVLIFDQRIVHRATLGARAPSQIPSDRRKHAVYMTVARNDRCAFQFAQHLVRRHSVAYAAGLQYPAEFVKRCRTHRINLMGIDAQGNPELMRFAG